MALTSRGTRTVHEVAGLAARDTTRVWVETSAGRTRATLIPLVGTGIEAVAFVAFLPGGIDATALIAESGGRVTDRFILPAGPTTAPSVAPTPAPSAR
jgi:hypothetical protein